MKHLRAEDPVGHSGLPAVIVQEVGEGGIAASIVKRDTAQVVGAALLRDQLTQNFQAVAEGMAAAELGLSLGLFVDTLLIAKLGRVKARGDEPGQVVKVLTSGRP